LREGRKFMVMATSTTCPPVNWKLSAVVALTL